MRSAECFARRSIRTRQNEVHDNEVQSPWKNLEGRPICSLHTTNLKISCLYTEIGTKLGCVLVTRTPKKDLISLKAASVFGGKGWGCVYCSKRLDYFVVWWRSNHHWKICCKQIPKGDAFHFSALKWTCVHVVYIATRVKFFFFLEANFKVRCLCLNVLERSIRFQFASK